MITMEGAITQTSEETLQPRRAYSAAVKRHEEMVAKKGYRLPKNFRNKNLKILHISSAKVSDKIENNLTDYARVKKNGENS